MTNLDGTPRGAEGVRHGDRDDGHLVRPRGARAKAQFARAIAEFHSLAVARSRAHNLGGESIPRPGVSRDVPESIFPGDANDARVPGGPVQHQLAGVHATLGGFHRSRHARHGHHANRRRVSREDDGELQRSGFFYDVSKLVRAVFVIRRLRLDGVLPGHARLQHQRRATAVDGIPAVILRHQFHHRAFARHAPLGALALDDAVGEANLHPLGARSNRRPRDLHAVEQHADGVVARV